MSQTIEMTPGVDYTKEGQKEAGWWKKSWLRIWKPLKRTYTWITNNKAVRITVGLTGSLTALSAGIIGSVLTLHVGVAIWATSPILLLPVLGLTFVLSSAVLLGGFYGAFALFAWAFKVPFDGLFS